MITREKRPDGRIERRIIIAMIVSTEFLKTIVPIYTENCLRIPFAKTVARWIIEYYEKYENAPGREIEDIFKSQKDNISDSDEVDMIENFLNDISNEYVTERTFNAKYIIDQAEDYFRTQSLKSLSKEIQKCLIGSRLEEAEALVKGYTRVSKLRTKGVDPITDKAVIIEALKEDSGDKLFQFPGALGETIGQFQRGWLFSFIGASGAGKTWWLMFTALRALFAGFNVVFISMEMSEKEMTRRIQHWVTGLPSGKYAGEMDIPVFDCLYNKDDSCHKIKRISGICTVCRGSDDFNVAISYNKKIKEELTVEKAMQKRNAMKSSALLRGNSFKLIEFPSGSVTMNDINAHLHNLEHYEEFIPDVIITDYADKIRPENTNSQYRHQIGGIWEGHKAMAQKRNCLVVTASQSNTTRTGKDIKQGDWAEGIMKFNLLDGGMAINMSPDEKKAGTMRALAVKRRHDDFDLNQEVMVLHQLRIGKPYLDSYSLPRKISEEK